MKKQKTRIMPFCVRAISPCCYWLSHYDYKKGKWVCMHEGCNKEFDWVEDGVRQIWAKPEESDGHQKTSEKEEDNFLCKLTFCIP